MNQELPILTLKTIVSPIPVVSKSSIGNEEALIHFLQTPLAMFERSSKFNSNTSAYGSLNCSYLELAPSLWMNEDREVFVKKPCSDLGKDQISVTCGSPDTADLSWWYTSIQGVLTVLTGLDGLTGNLLVVLCMVDTLDPFQSASSSVILMESW